jgi:hypothetical protein
MFERKLIGSRHYRHHSHVIRKDECSMPILILWRENRFDNYKVQATKTGRIMSPIIFYAFTTFTNIMQKRPFLLVDSRKKS